MKGARGGACSNAKISYRECTPSVSKIIDRCVFTVFGDRSSLRQISLLLRPRPSNSRISRCRRGRPERVERRLCRLLGEIVRLIGIRQAYIYFRQRVQGDEDSPVHDHHQRLPEHVATALLRNEAAGTAGQGQANRRRIRHGREDGNRQRRIMLPQCPEGGETVVSGKRQVEQEQVDIRRPGQARYCLGYRSDRRDVCGDEYLLSTRTSASQIKGWSSTTRMRFGRPGR